MEVDQFPKNAVFRPHYGAQGELHFHEGPLRCSAMLSLQESIAQGIHRNS
jgi:hypothetical protein